MLDLIAHVIKGLADFIGVVLVILFYLAIAGVLWLGLKTVFGGA